MAITINGTTGLAGVDGSAGTPAVQGADTNTGMFFPAADTIAFSGGGVESMRIDSSGNFMLGTTIVGGEGGLSILPNFDDGAARIIFDRASTAASSIVQSFRNAGTASGQISYTNTATSYTTSSDYRLKENVAPMTGALEKIAALKPCTYKWKVDGTAGQGFIAHELQEVVPDCVGGEKDALDANGNPQYQGVDTSFLVATLTAAIQEQQALIVQLQADVATLKGATP